MLQQPPCSVAPPLEMFDLAVALYHGHGCTANRPVALEWWRRGGEAGHVRCKLRLADALLDGQDADGGAAEKFISLCGEVAGALADEVRRRVIDAALDAMEPDAWEGAVPGDQWVPMWRSMLSGDGDVAEADVAGAGFSKACECGHVAVVRGLLALSGNRTVDLHAMNGGVFIAACCIGHLDVVRHLLGLTGDRRVDVHAEDEKAFLDACYNGHADVVHELLALSGDRTVDVHAKEEAAFGRHAKRATWMWCLSC